MTSATDDDGEVTTDEEDAPRLRQPTRRPTPSTSFSGKFVDLDKLPMRFSADLAEEMTPMSALLTMWPMSLFELAAEMSSLKMKNHPPAADKRSPNGASGNPKPFTTEEMVHFFGISVGMGLHKCSRYRDYWKQGASTSVGALPHPNFKTIMLSGRYELIRTNLRFVDVHEYKKKKAVGKQTRILSTRFAQCLTLFSKHLLTQG
jgi:hypothetical protein